MSCATIVDVETTGLDEPDVIELAYIGPLDEMTPPNPLVTVRRFKPRKPIELGALAAHHILDEDLEQEEPWSGTWTPPAPTDYLIGHNVEFDWKALGRPPPLKRICTLALSRRLWPAAGSHSLSALAYLHSSDRRETRERLRFAHQAAGDALRCLELLSKILQALPQVGSWESLYQESEKARVPTHLTFGKYGPDSEYARKNGGPMPCSEIRKIDPSYHWWLLERCDQVKEDPYLRRALEPA